MAPTVGIISCAAKGHRVENRQFTIRVNNCENPGIQKKSPNCPISLGIQCLTDIPENLEATIQLNAHDPISLNGEIAINLIKRVSVIFWRFLKNSFNHCGFVPPFQQYAFVQIAQQGEN
jgi:hypothetical protein